jgi:hypothetical protein
MSVDLSSLAQVSFDTTLEMLTQSWHVYYNQQIINLNFICLKGYTVICGEKRAIQTKKKSIQCSVSIKTEKLKKLYKRLLKLHYQKSINIPYYP